MTRKKPRPLCSVCNREVPWGRVPPYCSKDCQVKVEGYSPQHQRDLDRIKAQVEGTTSWRPLPTEPVSELVVQNLLILSDVHCPIHSAKWLYQAVRVGLALGCTEVLINGDFIDATPISQHRGTFWNRRNILEDDLASAEAVLKLLCENFKAVHLLTGNHDARLIRAFGGEVSPSRLYKLLGAFDNFKTTGRFYVDVNRSWKIIHPRQYSKIRGKLAQDLAVRWQMNVALGHEHHSARAVSACGKFQCVAIGTLVDLDMQDYCTYEASTHVAPVNGFAVLRGDTMLLFDKFTPWKLMGLPGLDE